MKKSLLFTIILIAILLTACGANATTPVPTFEPDVAASSRVIAEGKLIPDPSVELAFSQPGIIAEVLVAEGDQVKEGQYIARLENSESMQADVARAEEAYLLAEQSFNLSQADALKRLADANEAVRAAQNNLDNFDIPTDLKPMGPEESARYTYEKLEKARADYEPYKYKNRRKDIDDNNTDCKIKNGIETCKNTAKYYEKRLNDAWADYRKAIQWLEREAALQAAKAELENKQKEFDNLTAGENSEKTAIARAQFETARANLEAARAALAKVQLRAPFTATVLSLDLTVGESVNAGLPVAFLGNADQWQVETKDLAEIDVANVSIGDPVSIKLDAFPDEEFSGTVTKIDPVGREYLGDMTYKTTIALTESDPRFFWNMTATVTIIVE
ncbi:MAG: efflux RND transporter periplasmic adaptor subunit [Anaerolineales bacterium]|nr:efflux RND transporter periplasmic adaptor subunit [Anaerolineales bacterium]